MIFLALDFFVFSYNILYWFYANGEKVCEGDWRWYLQQENEIQS